MDQIAHLVPILSSIWPSALADRSNEYFWRLEWVFHGSCTAHLDNFGSVESYFRKALTFFRSLRLNEKLTKLIGPIDQQITRIEVDKSKFIETFSNQRGKTFKIELRCQKDELGREYLTELRFCFNVTSGNSIRDCPKRGNCSSDDKILLVQPNAVQTVDHHAESLPFWAQFQSRLNQEKTSYDWLESHYKHIF